MNKRFEFTKFSSKPALQAAAATWITDRLKDAILRRGRACFFAAGGSTPGPIYQQMQTADLDWSKLKVGLGDERWVDEGHKRSNAAMIRQTLLQGAAVRADFLPMKVAGDDPFAAAGFVDEQYRGLGIADVLLAGMGPDSHTLSWFPGGRGYEAATDTETEARVAALEAIESDVTGSETLRMTVTYPVVAEARAVLLLITGIDKRQVFETAGPTTPIGTLIQAAGQALTVFYTD